jgi:ABC-type amino acid transport substrate-binding protein
MKGGNKMKFNKFIKTVTAITTLTAMLALVGCGSSAPANTVFTLDDLPKKTMGVQLGTTGDIYASDYEKEGSTIEKYNKGADAILALKQGKVDCVIIDNEPAKVFVSKNDDLKILDEPFAIEDYAISIS